MTKCVSCNNCGHVGWSKPKGSAFITLILAFFFIVPAIIYEVWRRGGFGKCEHCGSQHIKPSNQCATAKPLDIVENLAYLATAAVVVFMIVGAYAIFEGGPSHTLSAREIQNQCMTEGLKYYQNLGQYPTLASGIETSTQVLNDCKNSKDGTFEVP